MTTRAQLSARKRDGDTCPACGKATVYGSIDCTDHNGTTHIDVCGSCMLAWERETRSNPATECCSNCAFKDGSPEFADGSIWSVYANTILGEGLFYCHKRVPFDLKQRREDGGSPFQHKVDASGKRCTNAHVCAGWIKEKRKSNEIDRQDAADLAVSN